ELGSVHGGGHEGRALHDAAGVSAMPHTPSNKWNRYLRFWQANVEADVNDEIAFHVDARTQELIDEGFEAPAARARALREFGDVERARGVLRAMDERHAAQSHRAEIFSDLWQDIRI